MLFLILIWFACHCSTSGRVGMLRVSVIIDQAFHVEHLRADQSSVLNYWIWLLSSFADVSFGWCSLSLFCCMIFSFFVGRCLLGDVATVFIYRLLPGLYGVAWCGKIPWYMRSIEKPLHKVINMRQALADTDRWQCKLKSFAWFEQTMIG